MKKNIFVYGLGIELTQRCNLNCSCCFRGESTNINITRGIIEKLFDEVKVVKALHLSGGEVFLAYEQLKMLLEVAEEKDVTIEFCSMLINGTIFDQRIYDLLDKYFEEDYQVGISWDSYHENSISRIYGNRKDNSSEPYLKPLTLTEVDNNITKHYWHPRCIGFQRISHRLIENGRAINLDAPKKAFEAEGYYYTLINENAMLVGPMLFIGADGYISDINSDISKRGEQSIGNILNNTITDCVINGGIQTKIDSENPDVLIPKFIAKMAKRNYEYATHQGDHLSFKNNKMAFTAYEPNLAYITAMDKLPQDIENLEKALATGKLQAFLEKWDPIYDGDLSQTEHRYYEGDFSLIPESRTPNNPDSAWGALDILKQVARCLTEIPEPETNQDFNDQDQNRFSCGHAYPPRVKK